MRIAVAGATGSIGVPVVEELAKRGHAVRSLSRRSRQFPVDLKTGVGLEAALQGCDVVVDASNGGPAEKAARAVLIDGGRRLLAAAAAAGVKHHVCISIIGIEQLPLPYYRVKVEQEALVAAAGLPYSIVRATQFHTLLDALFAAACRYRVLPGGRARLQPVDPRQVAEVIAAVAEARPAAARTTVAGPRLHDLRELAAVWRTVRGRRARIVPPPLPPKLGRPLRDGALTDPGADHRGTVDFATWLAA